MTHRQDEPASTAKREQVLKGRLSARERATAFCFAVLRDFRAAEDVYQEAALVATRRADQYRGENFEQWFWVILRHVLGSHLRRSRRSPVLADSELLDRAQALAHQEDTPTPEENVDHLLKCLDQLSGTMRKVLEWRFLENLDCAAVAQRLGRTRQAA